MTSQHGTHNDLYANSPIYRFLLLTRFYGGD